MRLNERCTALVAVLTLLLLLDSSWAQKQHPEKPPKKQKPISDPHYKYKKQQDDYYGSHGAYAGYGQQRGGYGGYGQPYHGGYQQPYPSSKQPYRQDSYRDDYSKSSYKQQGYRKDGYGYDSYDSYGSYDKKHKKQKDEPTLSTKIEFTVNKCSLRYPGVGKDTTKDPLDPNFGLIAKPRETQDEEDLNVANFLTRTSTVVGWWSMGCKQSRAMKKKHKRDHDGDYGYDKGYYADEESSSSSSSSGSYNETESSTGSYSGSDYSYRGGGGWNPDKVIENVGTCWYKGITDYGIPYKYTTSQTKVMGTFISFICTLNPEQARHCDPGLDTVDEDDDQLYFGGHGRVGITYTYTAGGLTDDSYFNVKNNVKPDDLLITGIYTGQANDERPNLPLTRYNVGLVTDLNLLNCANENEPYPDGGQSDLNDVTRPAGKDSNFKVVLST